MSQPSKMFIARETLHKSWQYQISRHQFFQFSNILKSYTPFYFTYISAPENRTEKFLYSRRSYGSHLPNELCPRLLAYLQPEKLSKNCGAFFSGHPVYSPQQPWPGNDPPNSQAENILQMTQQIMQQRKRTPTHRLESHEVGSQRGTFSCWLKGRKQKIKNHELFSHYIMCKESPKNSAPYHEWIHKLLFKRNFRGKL